MASIALSSIAWAVLAQNPETSRSWDILLLAQLSAPQAVTSLYILTSLTSTVSNEKLVRKSGGLAPKSDSGYDKGEKVAKSTAACLSMKKQLS